METGDCTGGFGDCAFQTVHGLELEAWNAGKDVPVPSLGPITWTFTPAPTTGDLPRLSLVLSGFKQMPLRLKYDIR